MEMKTTNVRMAIGLAIVGAVLFVSLGGLVCSSTSDKLVRERSLVTCCFDLHKRWLESKERTRFRINVPRRGH